MLLLHFSLTYGLVKSPLSDWFPREWVRALIINGNFGVTIFFVVSGYLITSNAIVRSYDLSRLDWRAFYVYRLTRILPALLLVLLVISCLSLLKFASFTNSVKGELLPPYTYWLAVASILTFWHNVLMQSMGYFNYALNIYWSLSVEEVFYLFFPILCVLRRGRYFVAIMLLCIVTAPLYRMIHSDDEIYFMYAYPACFDAVAIGCLTALLAQRYQFAARVGSVVRVFGVTALVACYFRGIHGNEIFGFTLIAIATALYLLASSATESDGLANSATAAPLRWLGRHSYELYLFHIVVLGILREYLPRAAVAPSQKLSLLFAYFIASALCAFVVERYFARPIQRHIRERYESRRAKPELSA